jgi:hypothetical protein
VEGVTLIMALWIEISNGSSEDEHAITWRLAVTTVAAATGLGPSGAPVLEPISPCFL